MELKGNVKKVFETIQISDKFQKRELVLTMTDGGAYPQDILVQFSQDNVYLLDEFKAGDNVVIGINLRGREWTNPQGEVKYFNTIEGWRISNDGEKKKADLNKAGKDSFDKNPPVAKQKTPVATSPESEEEDDLPF